MIIFFGLTILQDTAYETMFSICVERIVLFCTLFQRLLVIATEILGYIATYPWRSTEFEVIRTTADPEKYLDTWIKTKQVEYQFIGLTVSFMSLAHYHLA